MTANDLNASDCCDVLIGTKANCARQLAESIIGGMPHYFPELAETYLFKVVGDNFVYIRIGRKDGKKVGKREESRLAKQIEAMV